MIPQFSQVLFLVWSEREESEIRKRWQFDEKWKLDIRLNSSVSDEKEEEQTCVIYGAFSEYFNPVFGWLSTLEKQVDEKSTLHFRKTWLRIGHNLPLVVDQNNIVSVKAGSQPKRFLDLVNDFTCFITAGKECLEKEEIFIPSSLSSIVYCPTGGQERMWKEMKTLPSSGNNKVYTSIINLAKRTDRREKMQRQLIGSFAEANFEVAVDGPAEIESKYQHLLPLFFGNDFGNNLGIMGCALSHYLLWKKNLQERTEYDWFLILEDDVSLNTHDWDKIMKEASEKAISEMIIMLGYHVWSVSDNSKIVNKTLDENSILQPLNTKECMGGAFAYMASRAALERLVFFVERVVGIKHGIDAVMLPHRSGKQNGITYYEVAGQHLFHTKYWSKNDPTVDTDVMTNHFRLSRPIFWY